MVYMANRLHSQYHVVSIEYTNVYRFLHELYNTVYGQRRYIVIHKQGSPHSLNAVVPQSSLRTSSVSYLAFRLFGLVLVFLIVVH